MSRLIKYRPSAYMINPKNSQTISVNLSLIAYRLCALLILIKIGYVRGVQIEVPNFSL